MKVFFGRSLIIGVTCALVLLSPVSARQAGVHSKVPARVDAKAAYVIYLHGRIIEDQGRRPSHPTWGVYEYQQILEALADAGLTVISEQRPPNTDMDKYAGHVVDQVRALLKAGVPAEGISVVGFSKGGGIAIRTAARLKNPRVSFVFLAACGDGDFSKVDLNVHGRILSVYEASDEVGRSCASLFAKPGAVGERSEIEVRIGEQHGSFYRLHPEWLAPLLRWVQR